MTRLSILKNRRLLTFVLLGVTLLFGGLAVFLAIAINNRNVNETETEAATVCRTRTVDASYCASGKSKITTSCDSCNPEAGCTEKEECTSGGDDEPNKTLCRSESRTSSFSTCTTANSSGVFGTLDIYCESCSGEVNCEQRNVKCADGSSSGGGNTVVDTYQRCNVYGDANNCPAGTQKWIAVFAKSCNNTTPVGDTKVREVSNGCVPINSPQPSVPATAEEAPIQADVTGWPATAACRYPTSGGSCAPAEFRGGCNPAAGKMCRCTGSVVDKIGNYTYMSSVSSSDITCFESGISSMTELCAKYGPGLHNGSGLTCGNTYRCPPAPPPSVTPTPLCLPKAYCDRSTGMFVTYDCSGTEVISRTPDASCTSTCNKREVCDAEGNRITYGCDGVTITSTVPDSSRCRPPTEEPQAMCTGLTFDKTSYKAGEQVRLTASLARTTNPAYPQYSYRIQLYNSGVNYYATSTYKNQTNRLECTTANCTGTGTFTLPTTFTSNTFVAKVVAYHAGTDIVDTNIPTTSCQVSFTVAEREKVPVACGGLSITRNGVALKSTDRINPGDTLRLLASSPVQGSIASRYTYSDGTGWKVIKGTGPYNEFYGASRTVDFKVPANLASGTKIRFGTAIAYKINPAGTVSNTCAGGNCTTDNANVVLCGGTGEVGRAGNQIFERDPAVTTAVQVIDPVTGAISSSPVNYKMYTYADGTASAPSSRTALENQLAFTCNDSGLCVQEYTISNTPASSCTNITVTNTTTNTVCTAANRTTCAKQGDNLRVVVTGDNATGYSLAQSFVDYANRTTSSTAAVQTSSTFNITVPSTIELKSANIIASTTNGVTPSTSTACSYGLSFSNTPTVTKAINSANSVNLAAGNVVTSASEVEYDLTIRNAGTAIKSNVLVVDSLTAFNPANNGAAVNPPFGDIISASNLTRTTGSKSTPSPVAPRRILNASGTQIGALNPGNTYTTAQAVKTVEWNRITALHPGEIYTGKVRVDIGSFTSNPTLRNTVCLYNDGNNNGVFDGITTDTRIGCASVDVRTTTPTFTVEKEADESEVMADEPVTYTVTLTNTSGSALDLNNVTVTDTIDPEAIDALSITEISDGGALANNVITWTGSDLVAAHGSASLAAGGTIELTFVATPSAEIFTSESVCSVQMINDVRASSTSPNYTDTAPTVYVTVTRVCVTVTPNPETGELPPTGSDTPLYVPIIGVGLIGAAAAAYVLRKRFIRGGGKGLRQTLVSETPEQKLRSKIRMRK